MNMNLRIIGLFDQGKDGERLSFEVLSDTNLSEYMLLDDTFNEDGKLSNKERHPFWFPDWDVEEGDQVKLFTKPGTNRVIPKSNGDGNIHAIYWGLKCKVWNKEGDEAFLIRIGGVSKVKVGPVKK